ncbi:MAG: glycine cleavage system protein GcvH [Nitrososphaerota archaeon]
MESSYQIAEDCLYAKDHTWVRLEGKKYAVIGLTDYAQKKLREIIYVELPNINSRVQKRQQIATIESVKSSISLASPISGRVVEVNTDLLDNPETINDSPYREGWIVKMELQNREELESLLTPDEYLRYIEELEEIGEEAEE